MARTTGPLFSQQASGTVGQTITHATWKGRSYARQTIIPTNPGSLKQTSSRAMLAWLTEQWNAFPISDADRATWDTLAKQSNISPFNAYVAYNLQLWVQFLGPTQFLPPDVSKLRPTIHAGTPTVTAVTRAASIGWTVDAVNDGWGLMIFRNPGASVSTSHDNLVKIVPSGPLGANAYRDGPLTPGQYSYRFGVFSTSVNLGSVGTLHTITVPG